jgi:hypothetical protein
MPAAASAAPVSLDFESGATIGQKVTNQYGPPGTPAGPTFERGIEAGFEGINCGPPTLENTGAAHSGTNSLLLNGCENGEFWPTAAFFSLGYSTDSVEFWIATPGHTLANTTVITTAFSAKGSIVQQEETILPPQASTTYKDVAVTFGAGDIAYVAIEEGVKGGNTTTATEVGLTAGNSNLSLDDLTYDPPSSPPESSFLLGANPPAANLVAGGETQVKIPVSWTNNPNPSASPVLMETSLPTGITGSFSPNPTTTGSSMLTVHAAKNAPVGAGTLTIHGYVDKGLASEKTASETIPLGVSAPFEIVNPPAVTVAPCSPRQVEIRVQTATDFAEPLTISVATPGSSGVVINEISGGKVTDPAHATTTVTQKNGLATATVTLSASAGTGKEGARPWTVTVGAPGYADQTASGTVAVESQISKVLYTASSTEASAVDTPALGQPGTQLTLKGAGFCHDTAIAIGDPHNQSYAESIASDGSSATFRVPRGAVTGHVIVIPLQGPNFEGPRLTVRSFRNTYGFSWENRDWGLRLNEEMIDELFGKEETNIDVLGWLIRKPEAYLFETMTNNYIPGGICFGMAYSSYEFDQGLIAPTFFPHTGGSTVWNLDGSERPSDALLRYVTQRFSLQFTDQLIPAELNTVLGVHGTDDDVHAIEAELNKGLPVLLGLIHWNGISIEGHTILAYDAHPLPTGGVEVLVANSNVPYQTSEEENPGAHDAAEFTNSHLVIKDGNWEFPELGWSGSEADLVVYHHDELPEINGHQPSLPNVFTASVMVAFGSSGDAVTQVSDGHGSLFKGHKLAPRGSWPKGVAPLPDFNDTHAPLQLVSLGHDAKGPITASVKRSKGGGAMTMNLPGLQANLEAHGKSGQVDQVGVDQSGDSISYRPGAGGTGFDGTLLASPGAHSSGASSLGTDHLVRFETSSGKGDEDRISFPSGNSFDFSHSGGSAKLDLTLSGFDAKGRPVAVKLPPLRIGPRAVVSVTPANWRSLASSPIRVRSKSRNGTMNRTVRGRPIGRSFATVRSARVVDLAGGSKGIALKLRLRHPPKQGWIAFAGTVMRGGHTVERTAPLQLSAAAMRKGKATLPLPKALKAGHYTLRLRALETTAEGGGIQASETVGQSLALRLL